MSSIIVDTNSMHKLFKQNGPGANIWEMLVRRELSMPSGGKKYIDEIIRSPLRQVYQELLRIGVIKIYPDEDINNLEIKFNVNPDVTSDDQHILALAERSGCRVLFSEDQALSTDFKNHKILPKPRGKVISKKFYLKVVRNSPPCKP